MILFNVSDIRLFWSKDQRFLRQFSFHKTQVYKATCFLYLYCIMNVIIYLFLQREIIFAPYSKFPVNNFSTSIIDIFATFINNLNMLLNLLCSLFGMTSRVGFQMTFTSTNFMNW